MRNDLSVDYGACGLLMIVPGGAGWWVMLLSLLWRALFLLMQLLLPFAHKIETVPVEIMRGEDQLLSTSRFFGSDETLSTKKERTARTKQTTILDDKQDRIEDDGDSISSANYWEEFWDYFTNPYGDTKTLIHNHL